MESQIQAEAAEQTPIAARRDATVVTTSDPGVESTARDKLPVDPQALRAVRLFADLTDRDLGWIAAHSEELVLEPGDIFMHPGAPAEWMFLALEGVLQARREQMDTAQIPAFVVRAGDVFGVLPFSRMTVFAGTGRAVTHAVVAQFPRSLFGELLRQVPVLQQRIVSLLLDRVRDATRREAQFEKLSALGKLSAGLAHELNNPAAAVLSAMGQANSRLDERSESAAALAEHGVSADSVRQLDALRREARTRSRTHTDSDHKPSFSATVTLDRSDREDALGQWLQEAVGAPDPWVSAPVFVDAGIDRPDLERVLCDIPVSARPAALLWLQAGLSAQSFFDEAGAAMRRITQLLDALRTYTNRDRMREMIDVDVRDGIDSTIALFSGRAREKGVTIQPALDPVPRIRASPGDLNQVWANLLDNAIDAAPPQTGIVAVRTRVDGRCIAVDVRDNGPGIPPELQERVFEPFFTTKEVGSTGLGLDVARRIVGDMHGGQLTLTSKPGETRFTVELPLATIGTFGV